VLTAWSRKSSRHAVRRAVEHLSPAKLMGIMLLDA